MRAYDPDLDARDPGWRSRFFIPPFADPSGFQVEMAYFAGNSLGLQPRATKPAVDVEFSRWAEWGVEGQLSGPRPWKDYHTRHCGIRRPGSWGHYPTRPW